MREMNSEEIDLRGLSVKERKDLLGWYMVNEPSLNMQGELASFEFLKSVEHESPEFVRHALREFAEIPEEGDEDPLEIPRQQKEVSGYR